MDWNPAGPTDGTDLAAIAQAGGLLTIDLASIRANYRLLRAHVATEVAGVIKADGYGLGAIPVARALAAEGCRTLFVAHLDEALAVRAAMPDIRIIVLHGATPGAEPIFHDHAITPVLNSPEQVAAWAALARHKGVRPAALLQVDSGMSRFGLTEAEFDAAVTSGALDGIDVTHVMSHLACADDAAHPANARQLANFSRMRARLPQAKASLSASSGIFLGPDYHFDLVRPGAALYGVAPQAGRPNPLHPVVRLQARVMQVRDVPPGVFVGYGATAVTTRPSRLATIAAGYADGFLRAIGPAGCAWLGDAKLPLIGRVSMDSIILDVTDLDPPIAVGTLVELLGRHQGVDALAAFAGTIGYEILTSLGHRYARRFIG